MELGINLLNQILTGPLSVVGKTLHMILSFWPTRGIATFRPLLVAFVCVGAFLVLFLSVMPCVPLMQLLFQVMILFGETFHCCHESLDLPLQGSGSQLVSLNVVGGRHRASKYHATLCPGSNSMANLFPQMAPIDDAKKTTSKSHSPFTLEIVSAQQKEKI